jgi:hypothetical protein
MLNSAHELLLFLRPNSVASIQFVAVLLIIIGGLFMWEAYREDPASPSREAEILAPLINPAKLDTLKGERAATPRLRKACYWIETARRPGEEPKAVIESAQRLNDSWGTPRDVATLDSLEEVLGFD